MSRSNKFLDHLSSWQSRWDRCRFILYCLLFGVCAGWLWTIWIDVSWIRADAQVTSIDMFCAYKKPSSFFGGRSRTVERPCSDKIGEAALLKRRFAFVEFNPYPNLLFPLENGAIVRMRLSHSVPGVRERDLLKIVYSPGQPHQVWTTDQLRRKKTSFGALSILGLSLWGTFGFAVPRYRRRIKAKKLEREALDILNAQSMTANARYDEQLTRTSSGAGNGLHRTSPQIAANKHRALRRLAISLLFILAAVWSLTFWVDMYWVRTRAVVVSLPDQCVQIHPSDNHRLTGRGCRPVVGYYLPVGDYVETPLLNDVENVAVGDRLMIAYSPLSHTRARTAASIRTRDMTMAAIWVGGFALFWLLEKLSFRAPSGTQCVTAELQPSARTWAFATKNMPRPYAIAITLLLIAFLYHNFVSSFRP
jgi:hypothetical protein